MSDYNTALELEPENFIAHYNRGLLRANVGENNLAIEDFNFIISIDPDDMMAIFNRGTLLEETGDYKGAIQDYSTVIKEYPKFLLGYQKRAVARRKSGDIKGALADEDHILKEQIAQRYGYSTSTSRTKNKTRKKSEVDLEAYSKPITEDENHDEIVYDNEYRGKVQNKKIVLTPQSLYTLTYYENPNKIQTTAFNGNDDIENVNQSKILPHKLQLNNHLVNLTDVIFSEHINHIAYLQNKISITPTESFALAIEYTLVNEFDKATEMFATSIENNIHPALAYFGKGTSHYRYAEAIAYTSENTNIQSPSTIGEIKLYHYRQAIKDFTNAIDISKDFAEAYYNRGLAKMAVSDLTSALEDFNAACDLRENFAEAYYNKGIIKIQQGYTKEGINDLSKAGELGLYSAYSLIKKYQNQQQ
jgi:tetratricopeptide (TPR) repeat protein